MHKQIILAFLLAGTTGIGAAAQLPWDGDANGDCKVNVLDLVLVRNCLNQDVGTGDNAKADVNRDGRINILDLIYVRNRLNQSVETGDNWNADVNGQNSFSPLMHQRCIV